MKKRFSTVKAVSAIILSIAMVVASLPLSVLAQSEQLPLASAAPSAENSVEKKQLAEAIEELTVNSISIVTKPKKLNYVTGQNVILDGIRVAIEYEEDSETVLERSAPTEILANQIAESSETIDATKIATVSQTSKAVGSRVVTITYKEKIATFNVKYVPKRPTIKTKRTKVTGVKITSTKSVGATHYEYWYSTKAKKGFKKMIIRKKNGKTIKATTKKSFTKKELKQSKKFYFKVRAYKVITQTINQKTKKVKYYSAFSKVKSCKTGRFKGGEYWRPEVKKQLKLHKIYSKPLEDRLIRIIKKESGGRANAAGAGGMYIGIFQFNAGWAHSNSKAYFKKHKIIGAYKRDNRYNGSWSIHRVANLIKSHGSSVLNQHWPNTHH